MISREEAAEQELAFLRIYDLRVEHSWWGLRRKYMALIRNPAHEMEPVWSEISEQRLINAVFNLRKENLKLAKALSEVSQELKGYKKPRRTLRRASRDGLLARETAEDWANRLATGGPIPANPVGLVGETCTDHVLPAGYKVGEEVFRSEGQVGTTVNVLALARASADEPVSEIEQKIIEEISRLKRPSWERFNCLHVDTK